MIDKRMWIINSQNDLVGKKLVFRTTFESYQTIYAYRWLKFCITVKKIIIWKIKGYLALTCLIFFFVQCLNFYAMNTFLNHNVGTISWKPIILLLVFNDISLFNFSPKQYSPICHVVHEGSIDRSQQKQIDHRSFTLQRQHRLARAEGYCDSVKGRFVHSCSPAILLLLIR